MAFHKVIGIDFGTTYSVVSIWNQARREVSVVPTVFSSNTVPSVVGLDPECNIIAGVPAQNSLVNNPDNTVIEVKRELGVYECEPNAQRDDLCNPRRIQFRGRAYLPQEIAAFILIELKRQAENYIGEDIHDAVITVPTYFKQPQLCAMEDAAAMARLNLKRLVKYGWLKEHIAVAIYLGADKIRDNKKHIYAIYDLGGGTCDVSILEVRDGNIRVVGTGSDPFLGGSDFDDYITGYVLQQIRTKHGVDLSQDPVIWARIKREAEMRKRELSVTNVTMINLPYLAAQLSVNIPITRITFETLIKKELEESLRCVDRAIKSADVVSRDKIEQVWLVGGSSRIHCIASMIAKHLGIEERDIRSDFNPDLVVSLGAAIVARNYNPSGSYKGKEIIIDRTKSYYSLLGVSQKAISNKIRKACDKKLKELLERQRKAGVLEKRQKVHDWLKEINIAYEILLNPTNRRKYNAVNAHLIALEEDLSVETSNTSKSIAPLVFISAKSEDYEYAQQIYYFLMSCGIYTFFAKKSLPELGNTDFRKEIDQALDQAKHLIVVTSCREHAESPWVEVEWGFFINEKRSGRKSGNLITVVVGSLRPADLPPGLRYYQIMKFKPQALEEILRYVGR